jgi:hypothetical protein
VIASTSGAAAEGLENTRIEVKKHPATIDAASFLRPAFGVRVRCVPARAAVTH